MYIFRCIEDIKSFFNLNGHGGKGRQGKGDIEGRVLERRMKSEKDFWVFRNILFIFCERVGIIN